MKLFAIVFLCFVTSIHSGPIVGGNDAPDGKYPYMVSIQCKNIHVCSGSILNNRWILTAAHCLKNSENKTVKILAGNTNLLRGGNGRSYVAEYIVAHKEHNTPKMRRNDIGMIRVDSDIEFDDNVQPIKLPEKKNCYGEGYPLKIIGWDATKLHGPFPNKLQELDVKVFNQKQCKKEMKHIASVDKSQICTLAKAGEGVCHRDSGGPLVANGVLVGIASFAEPCATGKPDVFTRVYSFSKWIHSRQAKFQKVKSTLRYK